MNVNLLCGDNIEILKSFPDNHFDFILTSPPYGDDVRTYQNMPNLNWRGCLDELFRTMKIGSTLCWVTNDMVKDGSQSLLSFEQAIYAKSIGFRVQQTIIWNKESCVFPDATRYYPSFEYVFILTKGKQSYFNPIEDKINKRYGDKIHGHNREANGSKKPASGMKYGKKIKKFGRRYNVWNIPPEQRRGGYGDHPAVMSIELAHDLLISYCPPNAIVLDPYCGSGTTGEVCNWKEELQIKEFVGIDISQEYLDIAKKRIEEMRYASQLQKKLDKKTQLLEQEELFPNTNFKNEKRYKDKEILAWKENQLTKDEKQDIILENEIIKQMELEI